MVGITQSNTNQLRSLSVALCGRYNWGLRNPEPEGFKQRLPWLTLHKLDIDVSDNVRWLASK